VQLLVAEETVGYRTCLEDDDTSRRHLNLVPLMHQIRRGQSRHDAQRGGEPLRGRATVASLYGRSACSAGDGLLTMGDRTTRVFRSTAREFCR
jgi:hypothetical protein